MNKIRLCLSGSGFRFAAHVGALAAIEECDCKVIEIAGTSGGSIVGSMYASGKSASELKEITFNTDFRPMLEFNISAIKDYSYCNGSKLLAFIQSIVGKDTIFKDLKIPLKVIASDIRNDVSYVFGKDCTENVSLAVKASSAVPFVYSPVKIGGRFFIDGGITANSPVDSLTDDGILKLCVKLTQPVNRSPVNGPFDIICRTASTLFDACDNEHLKIGDLEKAVFSIVNTGSIGSFDNTLSQEDLLSMYNAGYTTTKELLNNYQFTK
jgi:NTE family protein